jgi:heat shock protein HslJ
MLFSYKWNKTSSIPAAIEGKWSLVRFYPAKNDTFKFVQTVSLSIERDGITAGFLGCNKFRTECTANGNNIRFGTILSSRKFCEREYMDLEDEIKSVLIRANAFSIIDNTLILSEGKTKLASFKKQ